MSPRWQPIGAHNPSPPKGTQAQPRATATHLWSCIVERRTLPIAEVVIQRGKGSLPVLPPRLRGRIWRPAAPPAATPRCCWQWRLWVLKRQQRCQVLLPQGQAQSAAAAGKDALHSCHCGQQRKEVLAHLGEAEPGPGKGAPVLQQQLQGSGCRRAGGHKLWGSCRGLGNNRRKAGPSEL